MVVVENFLHARSGLDSHSPTIFLLSFLPSCSCLSFFCAHLLCHFSLAYFPLTQRLFQALYVLLLLAFIYCTAMTLTMPYFLEHQAFFKSAVSPFSFLLTYFADVQCVVAAISVFAVRLLEPGWIDLDDVVGFQTSLLTTLFYLYTQGRPNKTLLFLGFGVGVLNLVAWLGYGSKCKIVFYTSFLNVFSWSCSLVLLSWSLLADLVLVQGNFRRKRKGGHPHLPAPH